MVYTAHDSKPVWKNYDTESLLTKNREGLVQDLCVRAMQ